MVTSGTQTSSQEAGAGPAPQSAGFAPLPLRARGTLELFDTAIKVYKRYLRFLLLWSGGAFTLWFVLFYFSVDEFMGLAPEEWIAFLLSVWILAPFVASAGSCCVAEALRGQPVRFWDCWRFTAPRFWTMWWVVLLAGATIAGLSFFGGLALSVCFSLLAAFAYLFAYMPYWIADIFGILFFIGSLALCSAIYVAAGMWVLLALVAVGMEPALGPVMALERSVSLLMGNWLRIFTLAIVTGLAALGLGIVLFGVGSAILDLAVLPRLAVGAAAPDAGGMAWLCLFGVVCSLVGLFCLPFTLVLTTLFYLDLRVRKEGLDIEWSAQTSGLI